MSVTGFGQVIGGFLENAKASDYLTISGMIICYHEQLPFIQVNLDSVWYYSMIVAIF